MRTPNEQYPEYHTSADNLDLVRSECLADSWAKCLGIVNVLEHNRTYVNLKPKCEPRLGKSGLYHAFGSMPDRQQLQRAILWTLNLSDGRHTLLDIAERSRLTFSLIAQAARLLREHGLMAERQDLAKDTADEIPNSTAPALSIC